MYRLFYALAIMDQDQEKRAEFAGDLPGRVSQWIAEKFTTIRFQVLGIVISSVLVPSFFGGWFASNRINDLLEDQVYDQIEVRTERLSGQLNDWLRNRSSDVQAYTVSYLLNEDLKKLQGNASAQEKEDSKKNITSYLTYLLEDNDFFSGIVIFDAAGSAIIKHPPDAWLVRDPIQGLPQKGSSISEITTGDVMRLVITQKMEPGRGLAPNTFTALMRIEHLQDKIVELAPEGSEVYLLDSEGNIKASNIELEGVAKTPGGALALVKQKGKRAVYRGLKGNEVIATTVQLEAPSWSVVFETSKKEALRPLVIFRRQILFMALALAGIFLLPALWLARALVLPLEELSRVSKQIKAGKSGLQVNRRVGGELGEFITTFNSMSTSLKDSMEDVIVQKEELRVLSITDPLTGKYNRRYIEDYLKRELDLAVRTKDPITILMIDLDHFKDYNDEYGHPAGDIALKQLGDILVQTVRKTDVVARYGGEEWIICLSRTNRAGGANIAEKLRKALESNVFQLKGIETRITVSIGIASAPEDGIHYDAIVEAADTALYQAKERGRNQVQVFSGPGSP